MPDAQRGLKKIGTRWPCLPHAECWALVCLGYKADRPALPPTAGFFPCPCPHCLPNTQWSLTVCCPAGQRRELSSSPEGLTASREGAVENTDHVVVKSSVYSVPSHRTQVKASLKYKVTFEWYFEMGVCWAAKGILGNKDSWCKNQHS